MDGRTWPARRAAFVLLAALVGCQSTKSGGPTLSQNSTPAIYKPEAGEATVARAVSTTDPKKKEPAKASTFVAVGTYREELANNPENSFAEAEQLRSSARTAFQDALKIDPKCAAAYIGLAKSYVVIEDAQQAFAMYEKALQQIPNDASLWYEKGLTHARFKDWDGAITSLSRASQLDPDNRLYKRTIGLTYARASKFNEAFAALRTCMKEEEAHYTLARMSCHLDRPDVAREYLALALKAHPTYMPAHEMIAELNNPARSNPVQQASYHQPAAAPNVQVGGIE
jgi:tetratricopeptide (TPR) repeat protein